MPLDRENVTAASRIMLPAYIVLNSGFGMVLILDPTNTIKNARALRWQDGVLDLSAWGAWLTLLALLLAFAWFRNHNRDLGSFAIAVSAVSWLVFGGAWAVAIWTDGATPLGPMLAAFVVTAHYASLKSIVRRDK